MDYVHSLTPDFYHVVHRLCTLARHGLAHSTPSDKSDDVAQHDVPRIWDLSCDKFRSTLHHHNGTVKLFFMYFCAPHITCDSVLLPFPCVAQLSSHEYCCITITTPQRRIRLEYMYSPLSRTIITREHPSLDTNTMCCWVFHTACALKICGRILHDDIKRRECLYMCANCTLSSTVKTHAVHVCNGTYGNGSVTNMRM